MSLALGVYIHDRQWYFMEGKKKKRKNLQALIITKFFIQSYKNMIQCSKSILKVLNYLHFSVEKWNCTHNLILLKKKKKDAQSPHPQNNQPNNKNAHQDMEGIMFLSTAVFPVVQHICSL